MNKTTDYKTNKPTNKRCKRTTYEEETSKKKKERRNKKLHIKHLQKLSSEKKTDFRRLKFIYRLGCQRYPSWREMSRILPNCVTGATDARLMRGTDEPTTVRQ